MEQVTTDTITSDKNFLVDYIEICGALFSAPGNFFRYRFPSLSTSQILCIGLVSSWMASSLSFVSSTLNTFLFTSIFEQWLDSFMSGVGLGDGAPSDFLWGAGRLILHPLFMLIRLCLASGILYLSALAIIGKRSHITVRLQGIMRILGISLVGQWLLIVPVLGSLLATLACFLMAVTGVREVYHVSSRRASAVLLAPYLLVGFLFALLIGLVLVLAVQLGFQGLAELMA